MFVPRLFQGLSHKVVFNVTKSQQLHN